jgi:hypothetical protein
MQYWPEILPLEGRAVFLIALGLLVVVLLFAGWFRDWWLINVLRNRLEAKRRLKREGRETDFKG